MKTPHDYEADDAAAIAEWRRDQIRARIDRLHTKRPAVFAKPGTLDPRIAAWCDRYAAGEPGNLVLVGAVGVGKTWSIWAAVEYLITAHDWKGRFEATDAYEFQRAVAPPFDTDLFNRWVTADLLALDDLGAQRVSEWDDGHLEGLIDVRWKHQRPYIITSNSGDLAGLLPPRSASRNRDNTTVVQLTGTDRRKAR